MALRQGRLIAWRDRRAVATLRPRLQLDRMSFAGEHAFGLSLPFTFFPTLPAILARGCRIGNAKLGGARSGGTIRRVLRAASGMLVAL